MDDQQLSYRFDAINKSLARMEARINFILKELKLEYPTEEATIPPELKDVVAFLKQGKTMAAIQAYRLVTGAPLADAKAAVETLNAKL